ncbi:17510_t:CDS:2, partial [Gigaspora rosea]
RGSVSKKRKKKDQFHWRNGSFLVEENSRPPPNTPDWLIAKLSKDENESIPLLDHYSGDNNSDFVPVARTSTIPPKTHITRNQFNKKRVRSDVVELLSKGKQKAVKMIPAPDSQPTDFNFNKINKGKQKVVEMISAPDTQPTDFEMNPSSSDIGNLLSYRDKNTSFVSDTLGEETEILSLSS